MPHDPREPFPERLKQSKHPGDKRRYEQRLAALKLARAAKKKARGQLKPGANNRPQDNAFAREERFATEYLVNLNAREAARVAAAAAQPEPESARGALGAVGER